MLCTSLGHEEMSKVVHCKKEPYDVYIGRPSRFGNPFSHLPGTLAQWKVDTREEAIECFKNYLMNTPMLLKAVKEELRDKILGCWCRPEFPCHGDVLLEISNKDDDSVFNPVINGVDPTAFIK
jgi:hypothetical protein